MSTTINFFQCQRSSHSSHQVEIVSDDDDDDDDDIMLTDEKYRPQSLEKMIALIAMLVEKSRGVDKQLHVSQKDYHSIVGGKVSVGCGPHGSCWKLTNSFREILEIK